MRERVTAGSGLAAAAQTETAAAGTRFAVTVLLNTDRGSFFGYVSGHALGRVFDLTVAAATPEAACEVTFAVGNSYPDELHCDPCYAWEVAEWRAAELRSLSVGDVLVVRPDGQDASVGRAFACAAVGFQPLAAVPAYTNGL
jgi:hypothetical protein